MEKVFTSSIVQQFTFAFISIWKIRLLYQSHELDFLGQFFVLCALFLLCQLAFDAARKTILSSGSIESSSSWNQFAYLAKRNFLVIMLIEVAFFLFVTFFFDFTTHGFFLGLLTIGAVAQIQSISGILLAQFTSRHGFAKANLLQTCCTIVTFPIFYFMSSQTSLSLLLLLNFASNLLPGLLAWPSSLQANCNFKVDESSTTGSIHTKFVLIQISENSANSLNAPMIGARLNAESVAEYSIFSRFAFLYDFVPMALFAFMIRGRDQISIHQARIIRRALLANSFGITILCFFAFAPIAKFLSSGKLTPDFITVLPYLVSGAIISYTSFIIQSSVSMELLRFRVRVSTSLLFVNLSITWFCLPFFGPSIAYLSTGFSTLLYAFFLFLFRRHQSRNN